MARLIQLVTPAMRKNHYGKIVNISSMGGKIWTKFGGWYHATKYAVEGLSDCLRMELKPFGIDVIVVEPGGIKTDWGIIAAENLKKTSRNGAYAEMANKAADGMIKNYSGILGFYDRFLDALHSLFGKDAGARKSAIVYLLKLGAGWVIGMLACVLALSKLFEAHIYFMSSLFLGLTLASFPFVIRAERSSLRGQERYAPFAVFGALIVILLTLVRSNTMAVSIRFAGAPVWMLGYVFLSGAVAIMAMVLPGISGSTILLIAGVYLPAIQAVRTFLSFDFFVVPGLCALGFGVLAGVGLSIHAIRAALRKYRPQMVWFILGLMAGSFYAIIMGTASLDLPQAPVGLQSFDAVGFALGIAILLGLEALRKWTARQTNSKACRVVKIP